MHERRGGPVRDETVTTRRTEEPCADVCKLFGWRCQLPTGHGGEHVYESDVERVTWTPRRQQEVADPLEAMGVARSALKRRMHSDDALDLPYDEDMAEAIKRLDAALAER
jgi:hypothetical protein